MTASDVVMVTVRVTAPKIEITNVEFTAVSPSSSSRTMREDSLVMMGNNETV